MPAIAALRKAKVDGYKLKVSLGYKSKTLSLKRRREEIFN